MRLKVERVGAASGFLTIAGVVANVAFTRNAPDPDQPITKIVAELSNHEDVYLATSTFVALQAFFFLIFVSAVACVVRRAEGSDGWLWIVVALGGAVSAVFALASSLSLVAAVFSTHHADAGPGAVLAPYEFHTWFLVGASVPGSAFLGASALAAIRYRALPRWLGWVAGVAAVGALVGFGYIFGNELDGGPLGVVWALSGVLLLIWIAAVSVALLRMPAPGKQPATT
ncbi:MAG: hypothetical protein ABI896_04690 [Actinomycetota bacterium]